MRMLIESIVKKDYLLIKVQQEADGDTDFDQLRKVMTEYIEKGSTKIALSLAINAYPYSKLISALVHCNRLIEKVGGTLAVVQPNQDFLDVLKQTKLDKVFKVFSSEAELAADSD
jgi:anti-anti-sigma factor